MNHFARNALASVSIKVLRHESLQILAGQFARRQRAIGRFAGKALRIVHDTKDVDFL